MGNSVARCIEKWISDDEWCQCVWASADQPAGQPGTLATASRGLQRNRILKVLRRLLCLEKIKYLFRSENLETREHLWSFTSVPSELFTVSACFLAHIITLLQLFIFQFLQDVSPPRQSWQQQCLLQPITLSAYLRHGSGVGNTAVPVSEFCQTGFVTTIKTICPVFIHIDYLPITASHESHILPVTLKF